MKQNTIADMNTVNRENTKNMGSQATSSIYDLAKPMIKPVAVTVRQCVDETWSIVVPMKTVKDHLIDGYATRDAAIKQVSEISTFYLKAARQLEFTGRVAR